MNPMEPLGKWMVIIGILFVVMGGLIWLLGSHGGKLLPGDIAFEKGPVRFYFPIVTCLVLSVLLSILFSIFHR